nr:MAG TPA: hypothetical protein [Caudoviricetes sp.]
MIPATSNSWHIVTSTDEKRVQNKRVCRFHKQTLHRYRKRMRLTISLG